MKNKPVRPILLRFSIWFGMTFLLVYGSFAQENPTLEAKKNELATVQAEIGRLESQAKVISQEIKLMEPVKSWKLGGFAQVNFNQVGLVNWTAGGENSIALGIGASVYANYKKEKTRWNNTLSASYGVLKSGDSDFIKSDDKVEFDSKLGYALSPKLAAGLFTNFKTQFTDTRDYTDPTQPVVSSFLAPAYWLIGAGFDYIPTDFLTIYFSPMTAKLTLVSDNPTIDETLYGLEVGETVRGEFGAYMNAALVKEFNESFSLSSKVALFNNYLNSETDFFGRSKRANIDVDWQTNINLKVNSYITTFLFLHYIYDDDVRIDVDDNNDGMIDRQAPRSQFKETLGIGLSYKF